MATQAGVVMANEAGGTLANEAGGTLVGYAQATRGTEGWGLEVVSDPRLIRRRRSCATSCCARAWVSSLERADGSTTG